MCWSSPKRNDNRPERIFTPACWKGENNDPQEALFMKTDLNRQDSYTVTRGWHAHKGLLFELSVFLFLIVPSMALSFFAVKQGSLNFVIVAGSTILRDLALVSLILFFLWHNGERVKRIGWTFEKGWKDIGIGLGLFVPLFFAANLLENALRGAGFSVPATPLPSFLAAKDAAQYVLASALVVVVAIAEETIFRGYLILRLRALTASPALAVLLSAAIFSLGHGYEGSAGVTTVGFMGLVFALVYLWRQSLVAPMVMHFLQDFIGIVLAPLFGIG
jgi:membrane protease YdiL (CAAX protease family)